MAFDKERLFTNWIWTPDWSMEDDHEARIVYFRKEIHVDAHKKPERKEIRITADSRYKLYVNGSFLREGPQKALDTREWFVDTADIAPYLVSGVNTVAVEVLRFPALVLEGGQFNANASLYRTEHPHLYVEDAATDAMGLAGRSGWKCYVNRSIRIFGKGDGASIQAQEDASGREELAGWKKAGFDDAVWPTAKPKTLFDLLFAEAPGTLVPSTIPPQRHEDKQFHSVKEIRESGGFEADELKSCYEGMLKEKNVVEIPPNTVQIVELSADTEQCGYLVYAFADGAGAKVTTLCSECYVYIQPEQKNGLGEPYLPTLKKGKRDDSKNGTLLGQESYYTVAGYGTEDAPEAYEPYWFRTFRYIQLKIETKERGLRLLKFGYRATGYPLDVQTRFQIPNGEYRAIWDISVRTLKRCMHETYMDCPFYEQYQYVMDTRSEILYTYSVSADDRLARQAMDAFRRSMRPDGMISACAPSVNGGVIPGFSIYYILMVHDHMMYFGDKQLVRRHMPAMEQILSFFENHLEESGVVGKVGGMLLQNRYWSFLDWSPQWDGYGGLSPAALQGTKAMTMESLLYLYGLLKAAELAAYIGRKELNEEYLHKAERLKNAIRANCMGQYKDKEGNPCRMLQDGPGVEIYSVHCQVFAVLTGIMDPVWGKKALELCVGNPEFAQPSVAFMFYVFRAMEQCGIYEQTDKLWDLWREMLRDHLTTCVENNTDKRSDCHAWGSLMCYEIPSAILGVQPAAPGYEKVRIAPRMGTMAEAKGEVITSRGPVRVEWKKELDGSCNVKYTVPEGMERIM